MERFHIIDISDAKRMAMTGMYVVVDLRSPQEYQRYHLDYAISMPDAVIEAIERMNMKNEQWILYCNRGTMSFRLASKMAQRGYHVAAVRGKI